MSSQTAAATPEWLTIARCRMESVTSTCSSVASTGCDPRTKKSDPMTSDKLMRM
ncbi:hypothetical protein D3C83_201440 [compost metagenome]